MSAAGDVDNDGYSDVLIVAPASDNFGEVDLYRGGPGGLVSNAPAWSVVDEGAAVPTLRKKVLLMLCCCCWW